MTYAEQGYRIAPIEDLPLLHWFTLAVDALLAMQRAKLNVATLDLEAETEAYLTAMRSAAGHRLCELAIDLTGCDLSAVISGPMVIANPPADTRRLYTWHCESHWYPKRRNFQNIWLPFRCDKTRENGTMWVIPGSHKRTWPHFAEYHGFGEMNDAALLQYEIPGSEIPPEMLALAKPLEVPFGQAVIFHQDLLHRSSVNESAEPSYAITFRVFDYARDLTISHNWAERPYRIAERVRSGGRPGMVV